MKFPEFVSFLDNFITDRDLICAELEFDINTQFDTNHDLPTTETKNVENKKRIIFETTAYITKMSALHMAVAKNQPKVVRWLINQGADLDLACTVYTQKFETAQKKKISKGQSFWVNADYAGKHAVETTVSKLTALELAEKLDNSCVAILKTKTPQPS